MIQIVLNYLLLFLQRYFVNARPLQCKSCIGSSYFRLPKFQSHFTTPLNKVDRVVPRNSIDLLLELWQGKTTFRNCPVITFYPVFCGRLKVLAKIHGYPKHRDTARRSVTLRPGPNGKQYHDRTENACTVSCKSHDERVRLINRVSDHDISTPMLHVLVSIYL